MPTQVNSVCKHLQFFPHVEAVLFADRYADLVRFVLVIDLVEGERSEEGAATTHLLILSQPARRVTIVLKHLLKLKHKIFA